MITLKTSGKEQTNATTRTALALPRVKSDITCFKQTSACVTYRQMNIFNVFLIRNIEGVLKFLLMLIQTDPKTVYRPVAPVYTRFLNRSISATQSVSRNSEGHMEGVQPIKCMLFILIFNNIFYGAQVGIFPLKIVWLTYMVFPSISIQQPNTLQVKLQCR